jgi:decaprenyl-phosphate phosphoribosyltransferase
VTLAPETRRTTPSSALFHALRPKQWVKNVLVAAAPLAAARINEAPVLLDTLAAIVCFCAASSAVYLVNDIRDLEADRLHPVKRHRPIAAGEVSVRTGLVTAAGLTVLALIGGWLIEPEFALLLLGYLALQAAYTFGLKHQPVLDIAVVASGFLLRAVGGGLATDIPLSEWFLLVASFGSLFMVSGKRYSELLLVGRSTGTRRSLEGYTDTYLRFVWTTAAAVTIGGYSLWAFSMPVDDGVRWEAISIAPFVLALFRYAINVDVGKAGEPEDIVMRDRVLQILGLVWLVLVAIGVFSG